MGGAPEAQIKLKVGRLNVAGCSSADPAEKIRPLDGGPRRGELLKVGRLKVERLKRRVSSFWFLVSSSKFQVSGSRFQVPGFKFQVFCF
jgi:hypothetical protein